MMQVAAHFGQHWVAHPALPRVGMLAKKLENKNIGENCFQSPPLASISSQRSSFLLDELPSSNSSKSHHCHRT
jgi:hypothetical protein